MWTNSSKERVKEMVDYSGLGHKINYKVATYSLGMKMRLMLAMVLMAKPKLIMLDEPMNGLDPDGVIELRKELEDLRNEGCAVLLSSHQLAEIEKVADRIVMIEGGKLVLDSYIGDLKYTKTYLIKTSNNTAALDLIKSKGFLAEPSSDPEKKDYFQVAVASENLQTMILFLVENKINILDIEKPFRTLEDLYESIISKKTF
ncbi:MAG: ATP-binding cassette domain-containing protein [Bacillota bacterium]|nr:ATP-binding cassette domain-containing protein [Bacillota bacterium]